MANRLLTEEEFERLALEDPKAKWELWCGVPRRKPWMTLEHNRVADRLAIRLGGQLDFRQYDVRIDKGHVRRPIRNYFIPDVFVIPAELTAGRLGQPTVLENYTEPLPLVVEVWSRSTGDYDQGQKLEEYKRRGDAEIWLLHPYERTLTAWRRQPDGSYTETVYHGGAVQPIALPNVTIDLDELFD